MVDGSELKRKRGAATVLALLVTFLFGYAPAAAQAELDRSARLGSAELVKRAPVLRTVVRGEADDTDADSALLPPPPRIRTELASLRPAGGLLPFLDASIPGERPLAYRARAPPAA